MSQHTQVTNTKYRMLMTWLRQGETLFSLRIKGRGGGVWPESRVRGESPQQLCLVCQQLWPRDNLAAPTPCRLLRVTVIKASTNSTKRHKHVGRLSTEGKQATTLYHKLADPSTQRSAGERWVRCSKRFFLFFCSTYTANPNTDSGKVLSKEVIKTRSSSACHVGPLALERVIIFAQSLCYERPLNFFFYQI